MILQVETRPGLHGYIEPVAFLVGSRHVDILQIVDRWIALDHSYFKIEGSDRGLYILRFASLKNEWELTMFQDQSDRSA
jgi:hypothetical protein